MTPERIKHIENLAEQIDGVGQHIAARLIRELLAALREKSAIRETLAALSEPAQESGTGEGRWIPVGERLPVFEETVLIYTTVGGIDIASHRVGRFFYEDDDRGGTVTHWQALPAPPDAGEKP